MMRRLTNRRTKRSETLTAGSGRAGRALAVAFAVALAAALLIALGGCAGGSDQEPGRDGGATAETDAGVASGETTPEGRVASVERAIVDEGRSRGTSTAAGSLAEEMTEHEGIPLSTFYRQYDNSIKGPQDVDLGDYRLEVTGLVRETLSLTYEEVLDYDQETRLATLFCVEGWHERLVFEGVSLADLLEDAHPEAGVATVVFHGADGYTTSLPYGDVERLDLMLAARINGIALDEARGKPFQLVAEGKQGYKWIRWLTKIELSAEPYSGFWERRGYSNEADVQASRIEREKQLIRKREPASPTPE
ncbi:MAG: molybdopterin-dependent oxidoreductase [Candidatus Eisenbacteria bacterium]|nr:molybdopterin-dependent oxidoreductase [Candidatus Eisenbacteria bacterium]